MQAIQNGIVVERSTKENKELYFSIIEKDKKHTLVV